MRKALVLGVGGLSGRAASWVVESAGWDQLTRVPNVKDFDAVVVVLPSNEDWEAADWNGFVERFTPENVADLISSGAEVFVLGDPRPNISWGRVSQGFDGSPLLAFGIAPEWESLKGERVERARLSDAGVEDHLTRIQKYEFSLVRWAPTRWFGGAFRDRIYKGSKKELQIELLELLKTRSGHAIAFRLDFYGRDSSGRTHHPGRVFFLPRTARPEVEDVADLVSSRWGVELLAPEPEWLAGVDAPGERPMVESLTGLLTERERISEEIAKVREHQVQLREILGLLYQQGDALERIVRASLRELGARVEEPSERNEEDGWLEVEVGEVTFRAVLEIGATRGPKHSEDRIRQLLGWVDKSVTTRGEKWRGLFVGTASIDRPVEMREEPFADQWLRRARAFDFSVLRSEDLLEAVRRQREGSFDRGRFWRGLFENPAPATTSLLFGHANSRKGTVPASERDRPVD